MLKIIIPNYRALSRNQTITAHWRVYKKHREETAQLIQAYLKRGSRVPIKEALVKITAEYRKGKSIDVSNIDDKIIIDGLMNAGVLIDDDIAHNPIVIKIARKNTGRDRLIIEVEELSTFFSTKREIELQTENVSYPQN